MVLAAPNLDDRRFDELFAEARSLIPRYLPEWTNWNESDPGIALPDFVIRWATGNALPGLIEALSERHDELY